jgi:hypothetical protein
LLVDFGHRLETAWPRDGRPEGGPFQEDAREAHWNRSGWPLAHIQTKAIIEMADHLMSGHAAPATLAGGLNGFQSAEDFFFVCGIAKRLHGD